MLSILPSVSIAPPPLIAVLSVKLRLLNLELVTALKNLNAPPPSSGLVRAPVALLSLKLEFKTSILVTAPSKWNAPPDFAELSVKFESRILISLAEPT